MDAEVVVKFVIKSVCEDDYIVGEDYFSNFGDYVRWLIHEETLVGLIEDDYEIISVESK